MGKKIVTILSFFSPYLNSQKKVLIMLISG